MCSYKGKEENQQFINQDIPVHRTVRYGTVRHEREHGICFETTNDHNIFQATLAITKFLTSYLPIGEIRGNHESRPSRFQISPKISTLLSIVLTALLVKLSARRIGETIGKKTSTIN
jgi:hypothetical protein